MGAQVMNLIDYLGVLIPLDYMTPEMQVLIAGCIIVVGIRLVTGAIGSWFEGMFK